MLWAFLHFDEGSTCSPQSFRLSDSIELCRASLLYTCTPKPVLMCGAWFEEMKQVWVFLLFVCLFVWSLFLREGFGFMQFDHSLKLRKHFSNYKSK